MTKLSVATTNRYKDSEGKWQDRTQWHRCVTYGPAAEHAANIQSGVHVFVEGEVVYRKYERTIETETGAVKVQCPLPKF